jgi:hypothetical protein
MNKDYPSESLKGGAYSMMDELVKRSEVGGVQEAGNA